MNSFPQITVDIRFIRVVDFQFMTCLTNTQEENYFQNSKTVPSPKNISQTQVNKTAIYEIPVLLLK